jgi:hypothetical protein
VQVPDHDFRDAYRLVARNTATASENRIHADDVASRYGFRAGLVPGVTVYAYAVHAIVDALGPGWVESGRASLRFRQPCFDGEEVAVRTRPREGGGIELEVIARDGVSATGWATGHRESPPDLVAFGAHPLPSPRPAASVEVLEPGRELGTIELATDEAAAISYLAKVDEPSDLYMDRGWLHPGLLLEAANGVLMANVVLPAWLHVESEVCHHRAVRVGEPVSVRARVAERWEGNGHQWVRLNVAWLVGTEPVWSATHVAIWQLAGG